MFLYEDYKKTIGRFINGEWTFAGFSEARRHDPPESSLHGCAILRHDVDLCLDAAVAVARIDNDLGIRSTFFMLPSSPIYNLASRKGARALQAIGRLGHRIGLHYDILSGHSLLEEMSLLEHLCPPEYLDRVASLHVTRNFPGGSLDCIPDMECAWSPYWTRDPWVYFSDSRGEWSYGHPHDSRAFMNGSPMHLNLHPVWYSDRPISQVRRLQNIAENYKSLATGVISRTVLGA